MRACVLTVVRSCRLRDAPSADEVTAGYMPFSPASGGWPARALPLGESHGIWQRGLALDTWSADSDHPSACYVLPSLKLLGARRSRLTNRTACRNGPRFAVCPRSRIYSPEHPRHGRRARALTCSFAPITPAGVPVAAAFRAAYRYEGRPGAIQYSARSIATLSTPSRASLGPTG